METKIQTPPPKYGSAYVIFLIIYLLTPTQYAQYAGPLFIVVSAVFRAQATEIGVRASILFLAFSTVTLLQYILSGADSSKSLVDIYRWIFFGIVSFCFNIGRWRQIVIAFYLFFIITFLYCVVQQIAPDTSVVQTINAQYVSEDLLSGLFIPGFVRSTGFNEGPGHVGLVALIGALCSRTLFRECRHERRAIFLSDSCSLAIIIMAGAKGAAVALLAYWSVRHFGKFTIIAAALALSITLVPFDIIFDANYLARLAYLESGVERLLIWQDVIASLEDNPINIFFGHGRVGKLANLSVFDSDWVFLLATQGLAGIFLIGGLLFAIFQRWEWSVGRIVGWLVVIIIAGSTNPFLTDIKFGAVYLCVLFSLNETSRNSGRDLSR